MTAEQDFAERHALKGRMLAFVLQYPKHFNGARAARDAGYSEKAARQMASRLLTKANVQGALVELVAGSVAEAGLTVQEVIAGLRREAAGTFKPVKGTDTTSSARGAALASLARIAGAFTEDRPNPNAGLSADQLEERVAGMLKQSDRAVLIRLRGVIDAALGDEVAD